MNSSLYTHLTAFHAICETGSIVGGARKLGITSPSVSKSLKLLEQHIGLPLFNRTTRSMELTEAGRQLLADTAAAMHTLQWAVESVQGLGGEAAGAVRICTARFAYQMILKPNLGEFCRQYPKIQLEITLDDGINDLAKEGFDIGIRFADRLDDNVVARPLLPNATLGVFASSEYAERHGVPNTPDDLKNHALIGWRFSTAKRLSPMTVCENGQERAVNMYTPFITNDIDVVIDAVRQGLGLGRIFLPNTATVDLIPVLSDHWTNYPAVCLYYLQGSARIKRVAAVVGFLTEKFKAG